MDYNYSLFGFIVTFLFFVCVCLTCGKNIILSNLRSDSHLQDIEHRSVESPPSYTEDKPPEYADI